MNPPRIRSPWRAGAVLAVAGLLLVLRSGAAVRLPRVFTDHLVLQRDAPLAVWGQADPGEAVVVAFGGAERRTQADAAGRWEVTLDPLGASATARELTVTGTNRLVLRDVLVGDIWLCSGQSNMEYAFGIAKPWAPPAAAGDPELAAERRGGPVPALRLFRVEKQRRPPEVVSDGWQEASGAARDAFSAVGYCFGRALHRELGVPVGLIQSAWGGSRLEEWAPPEAYAALAAVLTGADAARFERDPAWVGRNYDAMVRPLAPFRLRGVIWYQGESNVIAYHDGLRYADKLAMLIGAWRAAWREPELPFYFVQVAPFRYSTRRDPLSHTPEELPRLWAGQVAALRVPGTGMVPVSDLVDDLNDIHPGHKRIVGERLAALALARTYGQTGRAWSGPLFAGCTFRGAEAIVAFDHADGLAVRGGAEPAEFELAAADGPFVPARAVIRGDTVVVASPQVPHPARVRLGWSETAQPNLVNAAGLPAGSFQSDLPPWSGVGR